MSLPAPGDTNVDDIDLSAREFGERTDPNLTFVVKGNARSGKRHLNNRKYF
jgi:hypothetical protein